MSENPEENPEPLERETSKPDGAEIAIGAVRFKPDTVYDCSVEVFPVCTFPKSGSDVVETVILGAATAATYLS